MKIRIKKNAYVWANDGKMRDFLKANEGKWFDVEKEYLFNDQYNIKEYRIFDSMIDAVKNDARIGKGKCHYCGTMLNEGETCNKYKECKEYGIEWFTSRNTYFLNYPEVQDMSKFDKVLSIYDNRIKIGTYDLEVCPSLNYFRLTNCRKTINFIYRDGKYFIHSSIGYTKADRLDIPHDLDNKLKAHVEKIMKDNEKR